MKPWAVLLIAVWLLVFWVPPAKAQLTFSLSASVQNSGSGQTVVFSGTLVNTGTAQVFLNNIAFTTSNNLISGSNGFYANVPGIFLAGQSYTGEIFTEAVAGTAPPADYTGTATIQGGANIFATTNLASASFTVLSPLVSIVATEASAYEFGEAPGTFTITRTGGTEIGLTIPYGIGGTAINGTDYQTIAEPVTIAAGSSSSIITITPILEQAALGQRSVTLTLQSAPLYDLGAGQSDTVLIQDTPYNNWRLQYFGASANAANAAPTADWTGDGIANLVAYGLNINPNHPNAAGLPSVGIVSNYLTLTYAPNPAAIDVLYTVEASTDLNRWSNANVQQVSDSNPNTIEFRYKYPVSASAPAVFLRLRLTPLD